MGVVAIYSEYVGNDRVFLGKSGDLRSMNVQGVFQRVCELWAILLERVASLKGLLGGTSQAAFQSTGHVRRLGLEQEGNMIYRSIRYRSRCE
jgi:hypothetical protein